MKFFNKTSTFYLWLDSLRCFLLTLIISFFLYITAINISFLDPFQKAFEELDLTDIYFANDLFEHKYTDKIILVNIDESDRCDIGDMINIISAQNPKVIGLDVIFEEKKQTYCDSMLLTNLQSNPKIILSYTFDNENKSKNSTNFFSIKNQKDGYVTIDIENDNDIVRNFVGVKKDYNNDLLYSFATQVALEANYIDEATALSKFQDKTRINYFGRRENFMSFNQKEIITKDSIPAMNNAIVLIGYLGSSDQRTINIEDKHYSPMNKTYVGRTRPDMYGLTIHANIVKMLESGKYLYRIPKLILYFLVFLIPFFSIMFGLKLSKSHPSIYDLWFKPIVFIFTVFLLFFVFWLLRLNIQVNITLIILFIVLGVETITLYKHAIDLAKKKLGWKSYI